MAKVHYIAQEAVLVAIDISKKRNDVVYTDDFGIADDPARFFQCRNDVLSTIAKPGIYNWYTREWVSTTVKIRSLRPVASWS